MDINKNILTKSEILEYSQKRKKGISLNESLDIFRKKDKVGKIIVFLSHKHTERELVESAISFLESFGIDVYVDWMDKGMPKNTSGETAQKIKNKIKRSDKFILLATDGAIDSKWCNWELGYGDAQKYIDNMAILPVRSDDRQYKGAEYLQIYPYISKYSDIYSVHFVVVSPDGESIELEKWLKR